MGKGRIIVFALLVLGASATYFVSISTHEPGHVAVARSPELTNVPLEGSRNDAAHSGQLAAQNGLGSRPRVLRANPQYDAEIARMPLNENMPELLERASGDPPFAYSLAMALQNCASAESAQDTLLEDLPQGLPEAEKEKVVQAFVERSAPCADLQANSTELRYDLVNSAAAAGVLEAQIYYRALAAPFVASEGAMARDGVMEEYKRKTVAYAREAAKTGEREALYNGYDVVSNGLFGKPDPVLAHAYLNAFHLARPTKQSAFLLDASRKGLTTQQLAQAEALRSSLMSTN